MNSLKPEISTFVRKAHCLLAAFTLLPLLATAQVAAPFNELEMRMKSTEVEIVYASPEDAAKAELVLAPLPHGKSWAFSTRWDDNNLKHLRMRDLLAQYGFKGGFYLNNGAGRAGPEFAQELVKNGAGVGLHGVTHPYLALENVNDIYWQIMANRVQREADTNRAIVAYAFSFNMFRHEAYPDAHGFIAEALINAGLHHLVQSNFTDPSVGAHPETFSVSRTLIPGDKDADPEKFETQLARILQNDSYHAENPVITLGIHTWHTEEGFKNLEHSLAKHANNPDWWYCEPNDYAAYRYRYHNTKIERIAVNGTTARYRLSTPIDGDVGRNVPLDIIVSDTAPISVAVDDGTAEWHQTEMASVIRLFEAPDDSSPQRIDTLENSENTEYQSGLSSRDEDFLGLVYHLQYDAESNQAVLTTDNQSSETIPAAHLFLRLPPMFENGIQSYALDPLSPGEGRALRFDLGPIKNDPVYTDGAPYLVAQIDFNWQGEAGRFFAVCRDEPDAYDRACPRDQVLYHGPYRVADTPDLKAFSNPQVELDLNEDSVVGWSHLSVESRRMYRDDCLLNVYNRDPQSKAILEAAAAAGESGNVAFALSFVPESGVTTVELNWPGELLGLYLNGQMYSSTERTLTVKPGEVNRIIIVPDEEAKDASRRAIRYPGVGFEPEVRHVANVL